MKERSSAHGGLTLSKLKEQARAIKRESRLSHREALEAVARQHGFLNWLAATKALEVGEAPPAAQAPPSPPAANDDDGSDESRTRDKREATDSDEDSQLIDTGSKMPAHLDDSLETLMRCALVAAKRMGTNERLSATKPMGFNFLLQSEDGNIFDGDLNPGRLIKPHGRDWGAMRLRKWIVKHKILRGAIYMDMRPESKKGLPDKFGIIGMEESRCLAQVYAFSQLLDHAPPAPQVESRGDGFWYDAFKMGLFEKSVGSVYVGVKADSFKLL